MSEIKLLHCPFCGSERQYITERNYFGEKNVIISCLECGISQTGSCETKEEAVEKWNARKPIQEIVEKLETEIEDSRNSTDINEEYYTGVWHGVERAYDLVKEAGEWNAEMEKSK